MDWDKLRIFHAVADAGSLQRGTEADHRRFEAIKIVNLFDLVDRPSLIGLDILPFEIFRPCKFQEGA